ncbi:MAG: ComF family protein [Woeseiaceae bacterium]|nr:ComF family protein [Woeseiaceae bacterium]
MWRPVLDTILPLRCVFCGSRSRPPEQAVCSGCHADLPRIASPPPAPTSAFVAELAPFAYDFPINAAIKALKYGRKLYYAPALAELLCEIAAEIPAGIDAVVPVPLHWRRRAFRGFNQAEEIGRPLARHLGVPLIHNVRRRRATRSQSGLSARERARNLRGAFRVQGRVPYVHVLIVDDVITTGVTLRQVAAALQATGDVRLSAIAVARTPA